jgi:hypothetical protein
VVRRQETRTRVGALLADARATVTNHLTEAPNYRWSTTVNDNARSYSVEGRMLADGCTWVRMPMVESIALRIGSTNAKTVEAVFKGPTRCVVLTPRGWKSVAELPACHSDWADNKVRPYIPMRNVGNLLTKDGQRPYSNAQFGLNCPHQELAIIVSTYCGLQIEGNEASGTLSNVGAQLLLVCDGQDQLRPVVAEGRFRLWFDAGQVQSYLIDLEGVLLVNGQACLVRQTSSTILHGVGTTSLELPEIVRRKLEP